MKISCDSCGAKYTIADAKVQGRKVKVRCKSCKATILVDGTRATGDAEDFDDVEDLGAPAAAAVGAGTGFTPKPGSTKKDAWSVNLTDDDSRDLTTAEIIAGWKSGLVTQDAYVWKDGMADWKPILDIPELRQKLLAARPLQAAPVVAGPAKLPAPAGVGAASAGLDDLFGGVATAGGEDFAAPAGRPAPKAAAATGARNESSVLFSLDALGAGRAPAAPQAAGIDIFGGLGGGGMLGSNTDLLTAPAKEPPPAPVFQQTAVPRGGYSAPAKRSSLPIVLAILGAAAVIGGGLFFVLGGESGPDPETARITAELEAQKAALEKSQAEVEAAKKAADEAQKKADEEAKKAEADEAAKKAEEEAKKAEAAKKAEEAKKAEAQVAAASPSGSSSSPSSSSSGTKTGTTTTTAAPSGGSGPFDVGAASASLTAAAANAASCGTPGGPTGSGKVQVTFATSGRVTSATVVSGPFGGTSVGGCVASKFRAARVPPFGGSPQTVAKSFTIK